LLVVSSYGRAAGGNVLPATFVIDSAGVVRFAHRASESQEWPSIEAVRAAIAGLPVTK
jgi:peroxiredoxin